MKEEQELSAAAHICKDMRLVAELTAHLVSQQVPATEDSAKYVWNEYLEICTVKAVSIGRNETEDKIGFVQSVSPESGTIGVILDKTSFYGEQRGMSTV